MTNLTSEQFRDVLNNVEGTEKIPTVQHLLRKAVETFFLNFGDYPELAGVAPGKVGIFGEVTQSSGGLSLSFAVPLATIIVGRRSEGQRFAVVTSADVGKPHKVSFSFSKNRPLGPGCPFWLNHVKGVIDNYKGGVVPPFEAAIESSIPIGSGLGSSSAIEVATYSFLELLMGEKSDVIEKVKACQKAEQNFALKDVGLLDRMTATAAWDRHMMLIDFQNNDIQRFPVKRKHVAFVYVDTHSPNLLEDDYAEENDYFNKVCEVLEVDTLRDATEKDVNNLLLLAEEVLNVDKQKLVQKKKDYKEVVKTEERSVGKFEEVGEIKKKRKLKITAESMKKLTFDPKVPKNNTQEILVRNLPSEKEIKTNQKGLEIEKEEASRKPLYANKKLLETNIKKDSEENEVEIKGEEEIEDENDLESAQFHKNMIAHVKLFLEEANITKEAINAWKSKDYSSFGEKMNESNEYLSNLYNFRVPVLDFLVETSLEVEGVLGSRMVRKKSGGGGVITLLEKKVIPNYCKYITEKLKEKEEELKQETTVILYNLLMGKRQDYKKRASVRSSSIKSSMEYLKKRIEKQNCLNRITPSTKCYSKARYCEKKEDYLIELINSCAQNALDKYDKQNLLDDTGLNLRRKRSLCQNIKAKRCGTWSRYPKNILYAAKLSKEKSVAQEKSITSSKKISLMEEGDTMSNVSQESATEKGGSKKENKEKSSKSEGETVPPNLKKNDEGATKKNVSLSVENEKSKNLSLKNYSEMSELPEFQSSEISAIERVTEQLERQKNPTFYVFSPFSGARMMFITKTDILRSLYANPVPHPKALLQSAFKVFRTDYGIEPTSIGVAPGTLTLFGEFMEFQLGYIICMALTMVTVMVGGKNDSVNFSVKTTSDYIEYPNEMVYPIPCVRPLEIESRNWANFIMGTVNEFKGHVPGFNAVISSSVPIQKGLNSCAALQACTFTFLENLTGHCTSDPFEKVDLCGQSEFEFHPQPSELVTRCSSVKFFPAFLCKEGHLMFINCKRYKISQYFFDHPSYVFLIASCKRITTNVTIESLDERLKRCVQALEILQRNSLLSIETKHLKCLEKKKTSEETMKRVKYVISEHDRTIEAVRAIKNQDYARVGLLMSQSHASLRDDYEVSSPEIELMIKLALEVDGVLGAKMLGKGLTATVVILAKIFAADDCIRYVRKHYKPRTDRPEFYITKPSRGAFSMNPAQVYHIP